MKIYVGFGTERKEKLEAGYINFSEFESMVIQSSITGKTDVGWLNIENISGWYKNKIDEKLVGYVATGDIAALQEYIASNRQGAEKAKGYLKELRFDGDGVATNLYLNASGWSLLNVAATTGRPEMVDFLVQDIGMDVNTICYGVSPIYCCFPSMHDKQNNFSNARLEAARAFTANDADLSHQITFSREGYEPSGLNILHTACHINDDALRHEALSFLAEKMTDLNIIDTFGKNALHHLFASSGDRFSEIIPTAEMLLRNGVLPTQRTKNGALPIDALRSHADKESFKTLIQNNAHISI